MPSRRPATVLRLVLALAAVALAAGLAAGAAASDSKLPCEDRGEPAAQAGECAEAEPAEPIAPEEGAPLPDTPELVPTPADADRPRRAPAKPAPKPAPAEEPESASRADFRVAGTPLTVTPPLAGGPYVFPVLGPSSYSDTWGAARATVAWHHGVDIFAPLGAPVVAVADGTVLSVGWNRLGGWRLWLVDREGNYFYYAHLSAFSAHAADGARVHAGTVLGFVGNTGDAVGTPYHLHFEIHPVSLLSLGYDGAVNPAPYLTGWLRLDASGPFVPGDVRWGFGLSGAAVGARPLAPAPAAVLLGYSDISSADGLSGGRLAPAPLEESALATPALEEQDEPAGPEEPVELDPSHLQVVELLEEEAARPARFAGVWDRLADCEASGDWGASTGNGFFGGLQFHPQTWLAYGGGAYAATADGATREQQIDVAKRVLLGQGWNAWPVCSRMLGLR